MAVLGKPVRVYCTCYELGHCWTPSCLQASKDVAKDVFREALKIYGALYLVTALLRRKGWKYYVKKFVPETLQSSLFLTVNGSLFLSLFCVWRRFRGSYGFYDTFFCGTPICAASLLIEQTDRSLIGCFYFVNACFLPAYLAATTALLFERRNRSHPHSWAIYTCRFSSHPHSWAICTCRFSSHPHSWAICTCRFSSHPHSWAIYTCRFSSHPHSWAICTCHFSSYLTPGLSAPVASVHTLTPGLSAPVASVHTLTPELSAPVASVHTLTPGLSAPVVSVHTSLLGYLHLSLQFTPSLLGYLHLSLQFTPSLLGYLHLSLQFTPHSLLLQVSEGQALLSRCITGPICFVITLA
ncbi:hypothetical protein ACOMHN_059797 [Nucella lapillus]